MAEFNEIARKFERMHKSCRSCNECPLHTIGDLHMKNLCAEFGFYNPELFVQVVEQWAEEHPEPVYPTWWEWLAKQDILEVEYNSRTTTYTVKTKPMFYRPIPEDIAKRLEIELKEG